MDEQGLGDQLEPIYNSFVLIQEVAWKTCREWWTRETGGKKGSGKSICACSTTWWWLPVCREENQHSFCLDNRMRNPTSLEVLSLFIYMCVCVYMTLYFICKWIYELFTCHLSTPYIQIIQRQGYHFCVNPILANLVILILFYFRIFLKSNYLQIHTWHHGSVPKKTHNNLCHSSRYS